MRGGARNCSKGCRGDVVSCLRDQFRKVWVLRYGKREASRGASRFLKGYMRCLSLFYDVDFEVVEINRFDEVIF